MSTWGYTEENGSLACIVDVTNKESEQVQNRVFIHNKYNCEINESTSLALLKWDIHYKIAQRAYTSTCYHYTISPLTVALSWLQWRT